MGEHLEAVNQKGSCHGRGDAGSPSLRRGGGDANPKSCRQQQTPGNPPLGFLSIVACLGLGCFLGWMTSLLIRGGVISGAWVEGSRSQTFDPFFLAATLAAAAVCLVFCLPARSWQNHLGSRGFSAFLAMAAACALCSTVVLGLMPEASLLACYGLGALAGASMALLLMFWLLLLSNCDPRSTVIILLTDVLIALASHFLIHFSEKVLRTQLLTVVVSSTLLLVSTTLLIYLLQRLPALELSAGEDKPLLVRFLVFAFVTSFIVEFTSVFAVEHNISGFFLGTTERFKTQAIGCLFCAAVVGLLLLVLRYMRSRPGHIVSILFRVMVLTLVMGMGLVLTQESGLFFASDAVLLLARFLVEVGVWIIALHAAYRYSSDAVGLVGGTIVVQFAGYFLGHVLHDAMEPLFESSLLSATVIVGLLMVLCVTFLFVFNNNDVYAASKVAIDERADDPLTLQGRCIELQRRYGLTEREAEVLTLLASGRNAVSIQNILCVSYNTVKAHKRNIYAKLGIHTQQELLTLVESVR